MNHSVLSSADQVLFVRHRQNSLEQARRLEEEYGAEIDIRALPESGEMVIHHDPWSSGASLSEWLAVYAQKAHCGPLILNTKEDGLEARIVESCRRAGVTNYFFLDTALPTLVKWAIRERNAAFACRVSAYEPPEGLAAFRGHVEWLWVDCFDGVPLSADALLPLTCDFKLCLVSPEMQGATLDRLDAFEPLFRIASAVCTKNPERWKELFCRG